MTHTRSYPETDYALRGEIADAIREYCHSISPGAVQDAHGTARIYYSGISLDGLTDAIFAAMSRCGPAAQAAWQPIETAPKDKTTILIAGGEFEWSNSMHGWMNAEGVSMASYDESEKCWRGENSGGHDEYYWHKPTHWMPLPTPPVSSTDRVTLPGHDETMANLDALTISSTSQNTPERNNRFCKNDDCPYPDCLVDGVCPSQPLPSTDPRCTCGVIVNPNIPHARSCPLSSTDETGAA